MNAVQPLIYCEKHPDVSAECNTSRTWTLSGANYFETTVWYCPTCLEVLQVEAEL